jgi:hypothetical protein
MTGTGTSSSCCCLCAGTLRSLSRRWQNHICSCLSVRPSLTDNSTRVASLGYMSSAPSQTEVNYRRRSKNPLKQSTNETQKTLALRNRGRTCVGPLENLQLVGRLHHALRRHPPAGSRGATGPGPRRGHRRRRLGRTAQRRPGPLVAGGIHPPRPIDPIRGSKPRFAKNLIPPP